MGSKNNNIVPSAPNVFGPRFQVGLMIGNDALVAGIAATVRKHGRNEHYVRYWRDVAQSGAVPNQWGGFREE